jgi:hypothetical protein
MRRRERDEGSAKSSRVTGVYAACQASTGSHDIVDLKLSRWNVESGWGIAGCTFQGRSLAAIVENAKNEPLPAAPDPQHESITSRDSTLPVQGFVNAKKSDAGIGRIQLWREKENFLW